MLRDHEVVTTSLSASSLLRLSKALTILLDKRVSRRFIIALAVFAMILGGFGRSPGPTLAMAASMDDSMAMSDCASMMGMSADPDAMDCGSMGDDGDHNQPAKCAFKDCLLRSCSIPAFQIAAALISYILPVGLPELRSDEPDRLSTVGKPPLPPPRFSTLA